MAAYWITCIILALVGIIIACRLFKHAVIISTAIVGSYLLIRGISFYAGHYYTVSELTIMAQSNSLDRIDPWFWLYLVAFILWFTMSTCIQYKSNKKGRHSHEYGRNHPYHTINDNNTF
mmetsp:Transcript_38415/g.52160  ORF Transcript_38415/g.52160 Transcript_38415/m.52160 type:complete len:119 (+) Transcript_38415:867-1223(+)